jgi:hypothetical protein
MHLVASSFSADGQMQIRDPSYAISSARHKSGEVRQILWLFPGSVSRYLDCVSEAQNYIIMSQRQTVGILGKRRNPDLLKLTLTARRRSAGPYAHAPRGTPRYPTLYPRLWILHPRQADSARTCQFFPSRRTIHLRIPHSRTGKTMRYSHCRD